MPRNRSPWDVFRIAFWSLMALIALVLVVVFYVAFRMD
jgi:hypothetical protein